MTSTTPGAKFRAALKEERPLQVPGAICAYHATLAKASGFKAIYLSGGGVAAGSLGLPDLGISNLDDVLTDVRRITDVCDLPLLVDVDTGFGSSAFNVARTKENYRIRELAEILEKLKGTQGISGVHIMAVHWESIIPRLVEEAGLKPAIQPPLYELGLRG